MEKREQFHQILLTSYVKVVPGEFFTKKERQSLPSTRPVEVQKIFQLKNFFQILYIKQLKLILFLTKINILL